MPFERPSWTKVCSFHHPSLSRRNILIVGLEQAAPYHRHVGNSNRDNPADDLSQHYNTMDVDNHELLSLAFRVERPEATLNAESPNENLVGDTAVMEDNCMAELQVS